jgi:hypothetical protein
MHYTTIRIAVNETFPDVGITSNYRFWKIIANQLGWLMQLIHCDPLPGLLAYALIF